MVAIRAALFALATASLAFAHPVSHTAARQLKIVGREYSALVERQSQEGSELQLLVDGNKVFRDSDPALLKKLTDDGQGTQLSIVIRPRCLLIHFCKLLHSCLSAVLTVVSAKALSSMPNPAHCSRKGTSRTNSTTPMLTRESHRTARMTNTDSGLANLSWLML